jgi:hypothetical protein
MHRLLRQKVAYSCHGTTSRAVLGAAALEEAALEEAALEEAALGGLGAPARASPGDSLLRTNLPAAEGAAETAKALILKR